MNLRRVFGFLGASLLAHCSPVMPVDGGMEAGASGFAAVQTIFSRSCAVGGPSCHNSPMGRFPILSASMSRTNLVGVMSMQVAVSLVTPGNPGRSFLMNKIEGTMDMLPECRAMGADCGQRMPMVGGVQLSPAEVATVRDWIASGAMMQ